MPRQYTFNTDVPKEDVERWIRDGKFTYIPLTDGHIALSEYPRGCDFVGRLGYVTSARIDPEKGDVVFEGKLFINRVAHLNVARTGGLDYVSLTHTVKDGIVVAPLEIAIIRIDRDNPRRDGCFIAPISAPLDVPRKRLTKLKRLRNTILSLRLPARDKK